jgi:hypothetical protein
VIALQEEAIHLLVRLLELPIRAEVEVAVREEKETELVHVQYQDHPDPHLALLTRIDRNEMLAKTKNITTRQNVVHRLILDLIRLDQSAVEDQHLLAHHLRPRQSQPSLNENHRILHLNITKNQRKQIIDRDLIHIHVLDPDLQITAIIIIKNHLIMAIITIIIIGQ